MIESVLKSVNEWVFESLIKLVIDSSIKSVFKSEIELVIKSVIESVIEPVIKLEIESVVESVIESVENVDSVEIDESELTKKGAQTIGPKIAPTEKQRWNAWRNGPFRDQICKSQLCERLSARPLIKPTMKRIMCRREMWWCSGIKT